MDESTPQNITTSTPQIPVAPKKPTSLIVATAICAVLAVAGIAFGVYELLDSNQKTSQISDLKTDISNKENTITELETTISDLKTRTNAVVEINDATDTETAETTTGTGTNGETATIALISQLTDTETTGVYKIGECTADSGTAASAHFSLKCHVNIAGKDALISYHDDDNNILRLSLPKQ